LLHAEENMKRARTTRHREKPSCLPIFELPAAVEVLLLARFRKRSLADILRVNRFDARCPNVSEAFTPPLEGGIENQRLGGSAKSRGRAKAPKPRGTILGYEKV
jgi:hypothetical protein